MKILITGGAGFIGSHIADRLITEGHQVTIVDNLSTGKRENINPKARFYEADIRSDGISEIFAGEKPEMVIHNAAVVQTANHLKSPELLSEVNITGTVNLLENISRYNCNKIIYASSAVVYGDARYLPIDERHPTVPVCFQGIAKLASEYYIRVYSQVYNIKYTILRYANVYGPRQHYKSSGGVVAGCREAMLKGKKPSIYGDGQQTRDFVYVADAVQANILALSRGDDETINISSGSRTTIKELVSIINCLNNTTLKPLYKPARPGEILHSALDNTKARFLLEWIPAYSLKEGLALTLRGCTKDQKKKLSV